MKFHDALKRAWLFVDTQSYRQHLRCAHLMRDGDVTYMAATNGVRLARFTISDMQDVAWDGAPVNIPPTVKLMLKECGPMVIAEGDVTVGGHDALLGATDRSEWKRKYPDVQALFRKEQAPPNACDLDGAALAKAWKTIPVVAWSLEWRMREILGGPRLVPLRVYRGIEHAAGLFIHEDGPVLKAKVDVLAADCPVPTGNAKHDRIACLRTLEWAHTERATPARVYLNADYVLMALNRRTATIRYSDKFSPAVIEFPDESHIIMPLRM